MSRPHRLVKVVLLGAEGVGKSCLAHALGGRGGDLTSQPYKATIGADFVVRTIPDPRRDAGSEDMLRMQLWDASGNERFASTTPLFMRGADAVLLCYDVADAASFQALPGLANEALASCTRGVSAVVVGLQADLQSGRPREVTPGHALEFARKIGASFAEVSARTGENVDALIDCFMLGRDAPPSSTASAAPPATPAGQQQQQQQQQRRAVVAGVDTEFVPLLGIDFAASIKHTSATLHIVQTFRNASEDTPQEVIFLWPIDDSRVAVTGIRAVFAEDGGRVLRCELRPKEQAQAAYDDALASGRRACAGEEVVDPTTGGTALALSFPLLPLHSVAVEVDLVMELAAIDARTLRFLLPISGHPLWKKAASGPTVRGQIFAEIEGLRRVETFNEGCDAVSDEHAGTATITLRETKLPYPDLEVLFTFASLAAPTAVTELLARGNELAVALSFVPELQGIFEDLTVTILVDRSGSMSGSKWNQASRATQLFIRSLPAGCFFNVLGFGSHFESVFSGCARSSDSGAISKALAEVSRWSANLGGTNLSGPLKAAIAAARPTEHGCVLLVTDGCAADVGAVNEVLNPLRGLAAEAAGVRVFTLGIGKDVSASFLEGIANECRGRCKLITGGNEDRVEPAVVSLLGDVVHFVAGCTISWGSLERLPGFHATPTPTVNCSVLATAFAICQLPEDFPREKPVEVSVSVEAGRRKNSWQLQVAIPAATSDATPSTVLHQLAARKIVHANPGLVDVALRHSVLCPALAFVAVGDTTGEALGATPKLMEVRLQDINRRRRRRSDHVTQELLSAALFDRGVKLDDLEAMSDVISLNAATFHRQAKSASGCCGGGGFSGSWSEPPHPRPSPPRPTPVPAQQPATPATPTATVPQPAAAPAAPESSRACLDILLRFQTPEGAFAVAANAETEKIGLSAAVLGGCTQAGVSADAWATALVLALFEARFGQLRSEWELVAAKAREWLASNVPAETSVARLIHEAKTLLAQQQH